MEKSKGFIVLSEQKAKIVDAFMKFIKTINNGHLNLWHLQNWVKYLKNVIFL